MAPIVNSPRFADVVATRLFVPEAGFASVYMNAAPAVDGPAA